MLNCGHPDGLRFCESSAYASVHPHSQTRDQKGGAVWRVLARHVHG